MKNSLVLVLSMLMTAPSFAVESPNYSSLRAYIQAQKAMMYRMQDYYGDEEVKKLHQNLRDLESSARRLSFATDSDVANHITEYEKNFAEYRKNTSTWSPAKEKAWKQAESVSSSAPVLEWASSRREQDKRDEEVRVANEKKRAEEARAEEAERIRQEELQQQISRQRLQQQQEHMATVKAAREAEAARIAKIEEDARVAKAEATAERKRKIERLNESNEYTNEILSSKSYGSAFEEDEESTRRRLQAAEKRPAAPQVSETDEEFTRKRLAEADKRDAEAAKAAAAAGSDPFSGPRFSDYETVGRLKPQAERLDQAWREGGLAGAEMARMGATRRDQTTAAGSTHKPDVAVAAPITAPTYRIPPSVATETMKDSTSGPIDPSIVPAALSMKMCSQKKAEIKKQGRRGQLGKVTGYFTPRLSSFDQSVFKMEGSLQTSSHIHNYPNLKYALNAVPNNCVFGFGNFGIGMKNTHNGRLSPCLDPLFSVAVSRSSGIRTGDIIYIPGLEKKVIGKDANGKPVMHPGCVVAMDSGKAITGNRLDFFTGVCRDYNRNNNTCRDKSNAALYSGLSNGEFYVAPNRLGTAILQDRQTQFASAYGPSRPATAVATRSRR